MLSKLSDYRLAWITVGCSMVAACSHPTDGKSAAQKMEAVLSVVLPKKLDHGIVLKSAVAEGDVLILTTGGPSDWTGPWSEKEMGKMVAAGFCQSDNIDRFFRDGGKVRFDISEGGNPPIEGQVLDHCPNKQS